MTNIRQAHTVSVKPQILISSYTLDQIRFNLNRPPCCLAQKTTFSEVKARQEQLHVR